MAPGKDSRQDKTRDEALGKLWDALQESGALGSPDIDAEDIETITSLHTAEDVPSPNEEDVEYMWAVVQAGTGLSAGALPATATAQLIVAARTAETVVASPAPIRAGSLASTSLRSLSLRVSRLVRLCTLAILASFIPGFFVLGGGARLAMRVAAMLSSGQLQGATTENSETVGEITLGGTFALMMQGWLAGVVLALVFLAIRQWLPSHGWRRAALTGFIFFAASGSSVLENGENADYERFGIAGVNICLFMVLPLLFGMVIGPVTDWVDARVNPAMPRLSRSPWVLLKSASMFFAAYICVLVSVFVFAEPSALTLLLALPAIVGLGELTVNRLHAANAQRLVVRFSYGGLAAAVVLGLVMTVVAVGRIV